MNKKLQFWQGFYTYHKSAFTATDWPDFRDNFIPVISVSSLLDIVENDGSYASIELLIHESLKNFIKLNWRLISAKTIVDKEIYYPFLIPRSFDNNFKDSFKILKDFIRCLRENYITTLSQEADIFIKESARLSFYTPFTTFGEYLEELVK